MKQLIGLLFTIILLSCDKKTSSADVQFHTQLELHSISYYDHAESFAPPLTLDISSEPVLLDLKSSDSIAVKYYLTERAIDYHDGKPPVKQLAGNLIFLERMNGEWSSIPKGEPHLDSIRFGKWIGQEIYLSNCDTGDDYFSVDYRYLVAKN